MILLLRRYCACSADDGDFFDNLQPSSVLPTPEKPRSEQAEPPSPAMRGGHLEESAGESEAIIERALYIGNYSAAVDACIKACSPACFCLGGQICSLTSLCAFGACFMTAARSLAATLKRIARCCVKSKRWRSAAQSRHPALSCVVQYLHAAEHVLPSRKCWSTCKL